MGDYLNTLLFGIYPYLALSVLALGSIVRYDREPYTWRSGSSQLLRRRQLIWGSVLFHAGILIVFFGHVVGLLTPIWVFELFGIGHGAKQIMAIVVGGVAGVVALVGATLLVHRRLFDARIRATSTFADTGILLLLYAQLVLGLATIPLSMAHLDGSEMVKFMGWAIALAAAAMTPAAAGAQTSPAAEPQAATAAPAPTPAAASPADAAAAPASAPAAAPAIDHVAPTPGIGVPDGRMGLQDQVTQVGQQAAGFHNNWLLTVCVVISLFVLALLVWTILRYRRGANPTPSRTSHNTMIEVVWTLVPVLILVAIAIPSIRLIRAQYSPPPADLTVKVIGNQWYWTYQYPDNGGFEIVSNMLKEQKDVKAGDRYRTDADGPPLLAVDELGTRERITTLLERVVLIGGVTGFIGILAFEVWKMIALP